MGDCEVSRTEFHRILYSGFSRPGFFASRAGHREVLLLYFGARVFYED